MMVFNLWWAYSLIGGIMFGKLAYCSIVWNSSTKWKLALKLNCPKHVIYISYVCLFLLNSSGSQCVSSVFLIDSADISKWSYGGCLCGSCYHASYYLSHYDACSEKSVGHILSSWYLCRHVKYVELSKDTQRTMLEWLSVESTHPRS